MAEHSSIEWTRGADGSAGATWTPIRARWIAPTDDGGGVERVGWHCEHVSEGCRNCYAESINRRLGTQLDFKPGNLFRQDRVGYTNGEAEVFLDEKMLLLPLKWRRPRRIFVASMTDLFADFVPDAMIDRVFAVMALARQHTFQCLTKRPAKMRAYITAPDVEDRVNAAMNDIAPAHWCTREVEDFGGWPLRNVWLGTSCENQATAAARVPELLATPAAVRFVSAEPLLGPIDFRILRFETGDDLPETMRVNCEHGSVDALRGVSTWPASHYQSPTIVRRSQVLHGEFFQSDGESRRLDWIIVGGESGRGARPLHPAWARSIRNQCAAANVAFFFKQWGEMRPYDDDRADCAWFDPNGSFYQGPTSWPLTLKERRVAMVRVGKKAAGRLLDGVTHDAMPVVRP